MTYAKEIGAPVELLDYIAEHKKLPVVNFAAGGIATPADAALMMQLAVMEYLSVQVSLNRQIGSQSPGYCQGHCQLSGPPDYYGSLGRIR
jgi:hypothetical protein